MRTPRVANMHNFPFEAYPAQMLIRIDRSSVWGNPYRTGMVWDEGRMTHRSKLQSLQLFETLMEDRLVGRQGPDHGMGSRCNPETGKRWSGSMIRGAPTIVEQCQEGQLWIDRLQALDNKILLCWCKPDHCHGDVIARFFDDLPKHIERLALHRLRSKQP